MSFDLKLKNGDLFLKKGNIDTVRDSDKLIQDILKITLTTTGTNPLHPWYGSLIGRSLIGSYLDQSVISTVAKSQLETAIEMLRKLQKIQSDSFQKLTPAEQIAAITDISISRNSIDPRLFEVNIKVLTRAFKSESIKFSVSNI